MTENAENDAKRVRFNGSTAMDAENEQSQPKKLKTSVPSVLNSNECITFHLLKKVDGNIVMEEDGHFTPEMTHQLFDDEKIKGYDGLEIDIFLTPSFQPLIDVKYASRTERGFTNLAKPFKEIFASGFFEAKPDFDRAFEEEPPLSSLPLNEPLISVQGDDSSLSIYKYTLATAPDAIKKLHARLEPLLYFFVEGTSSIDQSDPSWNFLLALRTDIDGAIEIAAFATLHTFYVFPDQCRLRLSQVLVLPPFQGQGIGSKLIDALYMVAETENALDITLEDPIDDVRRLRDRKDLTTMLPLDWLRTRAQGQIDSLVDGDKGKEARSNDDDQKSKNIDGGDGERILKALSPSPDILSKLQKELRMSKQQSQRMWETLLYALAANTNEHAVALVESFIRANFASQVASAKRGAEGKAVVDTPSGFIMFRSKKAAQGAAPGAIAVEGVSAAQQQDAIENAVAFRIEEMQRVLGIKTSSDSDDDDDDEQNE